MRRLVVLELRERCGVSGRPLHREERGPGVERSRIKRHPHPHNGGARGASGGREAVDVVDDVSCRRHLDELTGLDEEVLHVDHDERRPFGIEALDRVDTAAHPQHVLDHGRRHSELGHDETVLLVDRWVLPPELASG